MTNDQDTNLETILALMRQPLLELVYQAATVHRQFHDSRRVQLSRLISIKTGGCPEDCSYCPQAARYATGLKRQGLMSLEEVKGHAIAAKERGASRVCMGAAWRQVRDNQEFEQVLSMVKTVAAMDLEVCCTLGMLSASQAQRLADAGLYAYNHNLDSSAEFYKTIISTRQYQDRLQTLENARASKLSICSGGIIGMGESLEDRAQLLATLASLTPPPESVPINALVPIKGTPLGERERIDASELVRMVAATRLTIPTAMVRLSAGRAQLSPMEQGLCFLAGANSIFSGEKLLTTANPTDDEDSQLFATLGLLPQAPFAATRAV